MNIKNEISAMEAPVRGLACETIPVVASSDENYARHMGVMFVSLLENTSRPERIHFFVIDGGIGTQTKENIIKVVESRGGKISFLEVDKGKYKDYPLTRNMTPAIYYRLSIPELFSESVARVIYLDCDLIVKGDISDLWEFPLNGNHVAAVQDLSNSTYLSSGLPQHKYFNSGVMIIDLSLWRRDGIADKVCDFKLSHPEKIQTNDQCALNGVLFDSWARLPLRWNVQSGIYRPGRGRLRHFTRDEIDEALWNPGIIHYIGGEKPWKYPCFHPLVNEYFRYMDQTVWGGTGIDERKLHAHLSWCFKPKFLKKYIRQRLWQARYAKGSNKRDFLQVRKAFDNND